MFVQKNYVIAALYLITSWRLVCCSYGEISRKKCREYAKAVYVTEASPILSTRTTENEVAYCSLEQTTLIIGGEEAIEMEFPHMAVIGFGMSPHDELAWNCGATLISENFILTAAHCNKNRENPPQKVRFGLIDFSADMDDLEENEFQERTIAERFVHPEYRRPSKYNDIALMRLDASIVFSPYIRPACLNTMFDLADRAIAIGFGKLKYGNSGGCKNLMKVYLDIIPHDKCRKYFKPDRNLNKGLQDSTLCAGVLIGGNDTCHGDSGGPLEVLLSEPYCMHKIIGVTSFGKYCGFANAPAIYTNISHYIPWIENIVWKEINYT